MNRLSGFARALVDERPGTTRDPVDVRLRSGKRDVLLIDTAGIRRPTKVEGDLEHHSVGRAIDTIRRAEVLALVIDATEGITDQDVRLARLVEHHERALILVCNKWDAAARLGRKVPAFIRDARSGFRFSSSAPMVFVGAHRRWRRQIIPKAVKAGECWHAAFQTSRLNRILAETIAAMDPPLVGRRRLGYVCHARSGPRRRAWPFSRISSAIFRRITCAFSKDAFALR